MVSPDVLLSSPRLMGARIKRREDPRLVTGGGTFTDDIRLPGTLHMQIVRSPYAHARILSINTDRARAMPGVVAAYTGTDVAHLGVVPPSEEPGFALGKRPLLAVERVRHVGDPVAAVVAETRYLARDAALAIEVAYAQLPAVLSAEAALAPGAPLLHDEAPGNVASTRTAKSGEIDTAFAEADHVVRGKFEQPRLVPLPLEPRVTLAQWDAGEKKLTVWAAIQHPHHVREEYARFFGLDEQHIRVIAPDVGGGFGAKADHCPDDLLVPWAAMQLGRPVKYLEDRHDNFVQTGYGRGQTTEIEAAVKRDGTILGVRARILSDLGAYVSPGGAYQTVGTLAMGVNAYRFKHIDYEAQLVYTNTTPTTFYRGAGRPEGIFIIERLIEFIAADLNLDPVEVRRRNFIPPDAFPYRAPTRRTYDSGNYASALDLALKAADYGGLRRWQAEQRTAGRVIGIGIASYVEIAGGGPTQRNAARGSLGNATIRVEPNGHVTVYSGSSPHGQGTVTSYSQIIADVLGIPMERIGIVYGDTDVIQTGDGTGGSRTMATGANAVFLAAAKIRDKVHRLAGAMLEANADDITLEDGRFVVRGTPSRGLTFDEVARRAYAPWGISRDIEPGLEAAVYYEPLHAGFPFGTHLAVVEVDRDTGNVSILRFIAVDDVGRIISPLLLEGQIHGGLAQGIAAALQEAVEYGPDGQNLTSTLMDYPAVRADDLPHFEVLHHSVLTDVNPLGTKGAGESGTVGSTPAVVNAVMDALKPFGVRHLDMPLKPERVWRAMNSGQLS